MKDPRATERFGRDGAEMGEGFVDAASNARRKGRDRMREPCGRAGLGRNRFTGSNGWMETFAF